MPENSRWHESVFELLYYRNDSSKSSCETANTPGLCPVVIGSASGEDFLINEVIDVLCADASCHYKLFLDSGDVSVLAMSSLLRQHFFIRMH